MAKPKTLEWCVVRLGDDHNWWVSETSDPVRWDVDGLSIIDPRQLQHLVELVDPLRDYGFDQDVFESAFIPFRIEKDVGSGKVRLKRVKESLFDSEEKLFCLADVLDEENGPYADLLDHLTRCRVKMLNDIARTRPILSPSQPKSTPPDAAPTSSTWQLATRVAAGDQSTMRAPAPKRWR